MEVNSQLHAPAALSPGIEPPVPIGCGAGWVSEPTWMLWRREKSQPLPGIEPQGFSLQPIAMPTELSRLPNIDSISEKWTLAELIIKFFSENFYLVLRRIFFVSYVNSLTTFTRVLWVCLEMQWKLEPALLLALQEPPVSTFPCPLLLQTKAIPFSSRFNFNFKLITVFLQDLFYAYMLRGLCCKLCGHKSCFSLLNAPRETYTSEPVSHIHVFYEVHIFPWTELL
jgi:hypothetical protein